MSRIAARLLLVATLLAVAAGLTSTAGHTQDATSGDDDTAAEPDGTGDVALVRQTTWAEANGAVELELDVAAADPADHLQVRIHGRLPGRFALAPTYEGRGLGAALHTLADAPVSDLDPDGDGRVLLQVGLRGGAGDAQRLLIPREGLHPVSVQLIGGDGDSAGGFVTHVARLPTEIDRELGLALVQPLEAAPAHGPDGSVDLGPEVRAGLNLATTAYAASPEVPVTFQVTPETLGALSISDLPLDAALLADIAPVLQRGQVAASPFVRVDPDALAAAGLTDLLGEQFANGGATLTRLFGVAPDTTTWVAEDGLAGPGLRALTRHGIRYAVVPHTDLAGERPDLLVQPFDLATGDDAFITALATEPGLQRHAGSTGSGRLDAQRLLTDLAAVWFERPAYARATTVVLPESVDPTFVQTVLEGVDASPLLAPGTVPEVVADADPAAAAGMDATVEGPEDRLRLRLEAEAAVEGLGSYGAQLDRTRRAMGTYADVFPDDPRSVDHHVRLIVSASADLTDAERARYLTEITDGVSEALGAISTPERAAITLPSRDGVIPVTLINESGRPATVVLVLESDKLEFLDGERLETTLPEGHVPFEIRVRARASGAFPLQVHVETPDGRIELAEARYTVRSTAVSGLGIALSAAAVAVLGVWWVRTSRRARAEHRARAADDRADDPADDGPGAPADVPPGDGGAPGGSEGADHPK